MTSRAVGLVVVAAVAVAVLSACNLREGDPGEYGSMNSPNADSILEQNSPE